MPTMKSRLATSKMTTAKINRIFYRFIQTVLVTLSGIVTNICTCY